MRSRAYSIPGGFVIEEVDECAADKDRRQQEDDMQRDGEISVLGRLLLEQANALNQQRAAGMEYAQYHAALNMRALFAAYDRAVLDPTTKIPTLLHVAIESLRKKYAP